MSCHVMACHVMRYLIMYSMAQVRVVDVVSDPAKKRSTKLLVRFSMP